MARQVAYAGEGGLVFANETATRQYAAGTVFLNDTGGAAGPAVLTANVGVFTLTGQTAGLTKGRTVVADQASFALSGQAAGYQLQRKLVAAVGAFTYTLASVQPNLQAQTGSYTLTGRDATLTYTPTVNKLIGATGSFGLTGENADLVWNRPLTAATGSFTLSGQDAAAAWPHRLITAEAGVITLSGPPTGNRLPAAKGSFVLSAPDVTLTLDIDTFWDRVPEVAETWTKVSR